MEDGKFYGYGFVPSKENISDRDQLKKMITPYPENEFVRSLMLRHAESFPHKKMFFQTV